LAQLPEFTAQRIGQTRAINEPMTPEERFTKIENALNAVAEYQARHAGEMEDLRAIHKVLALALSKTAEMQQASTKEFREGMNQFREGMKELRETQRTTEEKLNALIDTVDRIIRQGGRT
jgi:hypothetical protein